MRNFVIAISGGIGAGKAELGAHLARALDGDRVSFGTEVRRYAEEVGSDPSDIGLLQQIGQCLVLTQRSEFVGRVLAQSQRPDVPLIVEGLRHVEILLELKDQTRGSAFRLIHVDASQSVREARVVARSSAERRLVARYDADITEVQVPRIIPQYADARINGELPIALQVSRVVGFLGINPE